MTRIATCLVVTILFSLICHNLHGQDEDWVEEKKKKRKFDLAGIPIISYNTSYGAIIGANTMLFFDVNPRDTISHASVIGLGGGFSQNRSLFAAGFTQLYLGENKWRIAVAGGVGNINFQYFESPSAAGDGDFVDYSAVNTFGLLKVLRRVTGDFYAGVVTKIQYTNTSFETVRPREEIVNANGIGFTTSYDSRNHIYNPRSGVFSTLTLLNNAKWMGSDSAFYSVRFFFNYYQRISKRSVLASRLTCFGGFGDVPFSGQQSIGGKDIRGYTDGKYRGDIEATVQTEYRWSFYKRWGMIAFFGLAMTEKPYSGILPGGGAGIRFKLLEARNVNIGIEGALGKKDQGIYFRIGETF
ncbi:BamA/TamA family outer membrane protein [Chryseolinea sp. T2]|uniref:BamA/TamA family outer membrane protein n=1 Tax=Chryseolinea sp. T2 TaxID=3129255 RepID=UPI0030776A9B